MAFNSMQRETPAIFYLIVINVLAYLAQQILPFATEWGALHYFQSSLFKPHQIITCMFLHGSLGHIFLNMFALWIFGSILEQSLGSKRFLNFYMICGIGASILVQLNIPFSASVYIKSLTDVVEQNDIAQM
ncbi:MAG: rhomboid family intramembrane serine protease, partial [Sphingobacteriales bacterium]|nr:rhomboid family intramembrane serine protease [Sphingobacteriales bacterium]